ncbi:MAG: phosphoribosyltransferase [Pyrinomonadaceae bacterium]
MAHYRENFLHQYCDNCIKPINHKGCGSRFKQIFEPIRCPDSLIATHAVCQYCLDLYAKKYRHESTCLFAKLGLRLQACGWATPASTQVLKSIKQKNNAYFKPLQNLIVNLLEEFNLKNVVIVPIPLGKMPVWKTWKDFLQNLAMSVEGVEVCPLINRDKQHSTRKSVAQIRAQIAREEYEISPSSTELLKDRKVVLLDDNVTTGHTMVRCAEMLLSYKPSSLFLLSLDRTISARVLQRCPVSKPLECEFKESVKQNNLISSENIANND